MWECYRQGFLCNLTLIKRDLGIIFKKPDSDFAIRQAALTLDMVFFRYFPENRKIGIGNAFPVCFVLLVYEMLIGKKLYFLFPCIGFPENLIDYRNN